jgi:uncharacterized delta-60 repeat protein
VGIERRHSGGLLTCFAALLAFLALPGTAAARPGALNRGFNGDGKVVTMFPSDQAKPRYVKYTLPYEFAPGRIAMAPGPGRKLVLASSKAIVEYRANGRRNRGFGGNGTAPIGPIEGARFQVADIAVDSQGRVLVAGTTKPTDEYGLIGPPLPGPLPTMATIRRYRANGELDPEFGSGGVLNTDFGVPPPTFEGIPYDGTAVAVVGLAVDAADRPIVAGSAAAEVGRCPRSMDRYEASRAIGARLTAGGAPDPTFAGDGTRTIGGLSWLGTPAATSADVLAAGSSTAPCPSGGPDRPSTLASLAADGSPSQGFAAGGLWSRPFTRISDLAPAPGGRIVLLARTIELSRGEWVESAGGVVRLRRNGSFDPRFGRRGRARLRLPRRSWIAAVAVDRRGRVLLAGTVKRKPRRKRRAHLELLLIRTTAAGRADRRFGRRGRVRTGFGARSNVRATDVLVDRANRIAVGGKLSGPSSGNAFALAQYLGGR